MIHPSYVELMKVVNEGTDVGEEPVVNSRYSIVCATAKRARQLIDGKEPLIDPKPKEKPLSVAVRELYDGDLRILTDEEAEKAAAEEAEALEILKKRQEEAEALAKKQEEEKLAEEDSDIVNPDDEESDDIVDDPDDDSDETADNADDSKAE